MTNNERQTRILRRVRRDAYDLYRVRQVCVAECVGGDLEYCQAEAYTHTSQHKGAEYDAALADCVRAFMAGALDAISETLPL